MLLLLALWRARPGRARAYSVLAHEANIDALWDTGLRPLLVRRYPRATREEVSRARAYAYGGAVIQDLGYYPFGSHFFSNLVHYVRTGEFVQSLIHESRDVNEYAFALGALAHYAADNVGHPDGVNPSVALMYPKLRAEHGNAVTYADSPATHVLVEFSFDVVQAAGGAYVSEAYQNFIGFQVSMPVLERAFLATYGLEMKDVFMSRGPGRSVLVPGYAGQPRPSPRSPAASPGAESRSSEDDPEARRPARPRRSSSSTCRPRNTTRPTGPTTRNRVCWRASWRSSTGCCRRSDRAAAAIQGADQRGRGALSRELQNHQGTVPVGARRTGPDADASIFAQHRLRHRRWPSAHGEYSLADETYAELLGRVLTIDTTRRRFRTRFAPEHQRTFYAARRRAG